MRHIAVLLILLAAAAARPGAAAPDQDELTWVAGSTKKIAQLTGDFDRSLRRPTLSRTGKRYGVIGTDLGSSFEHDGRLFFLFGDTWGQPGLRDAVAWTRSHDPAEIVLDFYTEKDGKWLPATVPGIDQGAFDVPSGGVSVGGRMYVVFTTDWMPDRSRMGRSVLAASEDAGRSFKVICDLSTTKFINVSFWAAGGWLYLFGSGDYRKSSVYLARTRPTALSDHTRMRYFTGFGPHRQPRWSPQERDAIPLFQHNVVGEFSAAYCRPVSRYVMLYNSSSPRGITMRWSKTLWGPWSDGTTIFDPWRDHGYGNFIHISSNFKPAKSDALSDPGREAEWGGEYGPYLMARYTTGGHGRCRIVYTLSTWNPYQVVVMQTDLTLGTRSR